MLFLESIVVESIEMYDVGVFYDVVLPTPLVSAVLCMSHHQGRIQAMKLLRWSMGWKPEDRTLSIIYDLVDSILLSCKEYVHGVGNEFHRPDGTTVVHVSRYKGDWRRGFHQAAKEFAKNGIV